MTIVRVPENTCVTVSQENGSARRRASSPNLVMPAAICQNWLLARCRHPYLVTGSWIDNGHLPTSSTAALRAYGYKSTNTSHLSVVVIIDTNPGNFGSEGSITITPRETNGAAAGTATTFNMADSITPGSDAERAKMIVGSVPVTWSGYGYAEVEWENMQILSLMIGEAPRSDLDSASDTLSLYGATGAGLLSDHPITDSTDSGPVSLIVGAEQARENTRRSHIPIWFDEGTCWTHTIGVANTWENIASSAINVGASWGWKMRARHLRESDTDKSLTVYARIKGDAGGTCDVQFESTVTADTATDSNIGAAWVWWDRVGGGTATLDVSANQTDTVLVKARSTQVGDDISIAMAAFVE